ncbi:MAG: patatin-like phospholipase family protein [Gammaproteobacteria bacterium]
MASDAGSAQKRAEDLINLTGPIGLALSGGGYRAAAFHLGTLDYLEHLGLQQQVNKISTVSGGTFTGVKYSLSQVAGQSFPEFFLDYYNLLNETDLLQRGLEKLAAGDINASSGRRDITTAMAQVYAETFLKKTDDSSWLFGDILNSDIALGDTVFNATEFRYGLAFRFQRSENPKAIIGNYKLRINRQDAEKIRMADIMAASSCFPGGFEPFAFPDDFVWPEGKVPETLSEQFASGPVALMDGGIYDNQGLQSLLMADERDPEADELAMFIISDVDQKSDNLYPYPSLEKGRKGLTLNTLAVISVVFIILLTISFMLLVGKLLTEGFTWYNFFLIALPALQVGIAAYALVWLRGRIKKALAKIPMLGRAAWKDIKHLGVDDLEDMISLRISSLYAMASSVFMKRVRSLVYGLIYGDFRKPVRQVLDELYGRKRISQLIYHLKTGEKFSSELLRVGIAEPSKALRQVADTAADMPTTLWFENKDQLQTLVASGQATLCYNLMKYLVRNYGENPDQFPSEARQLWGRLEADWQAFNENPLFLVEQSLANALQQGCGRKG